MSFDMFDHDPTFDVPAPKHAHSMRGQLATTTAALQYLRAGKATVTLVSKATQKRFTYEVNLSEDGNCYFVSVLVGPDNSRDFKYLGRIARDLFWAGRKVPRPGDIARDAPSATAFAWAWRNLIRGTLPAQLEIYHEGSCGRCGRKLTVPESIESGFGPECRNKIFG